MTFYCLRTSSQQIKTLCLNDIKLPPKRERLDLDARAENEARNYGQESEGGGGGRRGKEGVQILTEIHPLSSGGD